MNNIDDNIPNINLSKSSCIFFCAQLL